MVASGSAYGKHRMIQCRYADTRCGLGPVGWIAPVLLVLVTGCWAQVAGTTADEVQPPDAAQSMLADEAVPSAMVWGGDGRFVATARSTEHATYQGNSGPVLDLAGVRSAVQAFRCPGTKLVSVAAYFGVPGVKPAPSGVEILIRKGGPEGPVVARRVVEAADLRPRGPWFEVQVDQPCRPESLWALEIRVRAPYAERRRLHVPMQLGTCPRRRWVLTAGADGKAMKSVLWFRQTYRASRRGTLRGRRVFWSAPSDRMLTVDLARSLPVVLADAAGRPVRLTCARRENVSQWFGVSARPNDHAKEYELVLERKGVRNLFHEDDWNAPALVRIVQGIHKHTTT